VRADAGVQPCYGCVGIDDVTDDVSPETRPEAANTREGLPREDISMCAHVRHITRQIVCWITTMVSIVRRFDGVPLGSQSGDTQPWHEVEEAYVHAGVDVVLR
jgi:hypothetical protein